MRGIGEKPRAGIPTWGKESTGGILYPYLSDIARVCGSGEYLGTHLSQFVGDTKATHSQLPNNGIFYPY